MDAVIDMVTLIRDCKADTAIAESHLKTVAAKMDDEIATVAMSLTPKLKEVSSLADHAIASMMASELETAAGQKVAPAKEVPRRCARMRPAPALTLANLRVGRRRRPTLRCPPSPSATPRCRRR